MKKIEKLPLSRRSNLVVQEMDSELMIYDLTANKAFCLNETSALVWQFCDGSKSVNEISRLLGQKLGSVASDDLACLRHSQEREFNRKSNCIRNLFCRNSKTAGY